MKKIYQDVKHAFESKILFRVLCGLAIAIGILVIFSVGIVVGFHKASFGRDWNEHYNENFGMGTAKMMPAPLNNVMGSGSFPNAHGAVGKIIKIENKNLIVEDKDNIEKNILTSENTNFQKGRTVIDAEDLNVDDFVVVIGNPNPQGVIEAKLIRVIPSPGLLIK